MAILVTGGAGYIGSHTTVELLERGYEVVIVDDLSNSYPTVIDRIETITGKRPRFYEVDILDREAMNSIFQQEDVEAVIHFAAYKAVGESVAHPLKYYHNNIEGTVALLEVMQAHGVKQIVYSSSATVYGMHNESPLNEAMPIHGATNPYGFSKIVNEQLLRDMTVADPDWQVILLRYFNPIGAHESGLIGEQPQGVPNNIMPYMTQVALGQRDQLQVFGDDYDTPDGTGVRDYIHVVDLALGHVRALEQLPDLAGCQVYNLGTGRGYSVLELVQAFEQASGQALPYQIVDRRPGDIATCYADPSKAEAQLHWRAERDLDEMCRDSWRWQVQNPHGYLSHAGQ